MQRYRVVDRSFSSVDDDFNAILAQAHANHSRALCLCRTDRDLALYVARRQCGYVLARWPGTGPLHEPDCDHYDAPDDLTGLGQVRDGAMRDDPETGDVHLKLAFPLKRGAAHAAPSAITNERNCWIVRRELLKAIEHCWAKGENLRSRIFIPEVFRRDDLTAIATRRHTTLTPARASPDTMMIVIGEVRAIGASRYGEAVTLRHLADWPLFMDADTTKRFHRRFASEEDLWRSSAEDDGHLILAASFALRQSGTAEMFDIALMPVTREWLPYENMTERELLRVAVAEQRSVVKGMHVDLEASCTIANITLTDTASQAVAVHLAVDDVRDAGGAAQAAFLATAGVDHWSWSPGTALPGPRAIAQRQNSFSLPNRELH